MLKRARGAELQELYVRRNRLRQKLAHAHLSVEAFHEKALLLVLLTALAWVILVILTGLGLRHFNLPMRGIYTIMVFAGSGMLLVFGWIVFFILRKARMNRMNAELMRIQMMLVSMDESEEDSAMWEKERRRFKEMSRL